MGQAYGRAETCYDVSGVTLLTDPTTFIVLRTSGEEDDGWALSRRPLAWDALYPSIGMDKMETSPLATYRMVDKYGIHDIPADGERVWRLLTERGEPGKDGLYAWRRLDKIRPSGMSAEDAVAWRLAVVAALDALVA